MVQVVLPPRPRRVAVEVKALGMVHRRHELTATQEARRASTIGDVGASDVAARIRDLVGKLPVQTTPAERGPSVAARAFTDVVEGGFGPRWIGFRAIVCGGRGRGSRVRRGIALVCGNGSQGRGGARRRTDREEGTLESLVGLDTDGTMRQGTVSDNTLEAREADRGAIHDGGDGPVLRDRV